MTIALFSNSLQPTTFIMQKPKYDIQPAFHTPPPHINELIVVVRSKSDRRKAMRVRTDLSAKSSISFAAQWSAGERLERRKSERRVYVETELDNGNYTLVYMNKMFDPNAVRLNYALDQQDTISEHLLEFLDVGKMPQA